MTLSPDLTEPRSEDQAVYTGSADALQRAMNATRLSEMLDCFRSLNSHSKTIEKDLLGYVNHLDSQTVAETNAPASGSDDFIQQAKESARTGRYILLRELVDREKKVNRPTVKDRHTVPENALLEEQMKSMKRVIAAQPSALEAIYLEALLGPDQWRSAHGLLQTSPLDNLTNEERQRLRHLLHQRK